jgi:hypothetical protein
MNINVTVIMMIVDVDNLSIPRTDNKNEKYSIVGRIKQLELKYLHQLSDLETHYLNLNKND